MVASSGLVPFRVSALLPSIIDYGFSAQRWPVADSEIRVFALLSALLSIFKSRIVAESGCTPYLTLGVQASLLAVRENVAHFSFDHIEVHRLVGLAADQCVTTIGGDIDVGQIGPGPVTGQAPGLDRPARDRLLFDRDQGFAISRKSRGYDAALVAFFVLDLAPEVTVML